MPWSPLSPPPNLTRGALACVTIGANPAGPRYDACLYITLRLHHMEEPPAFLRPKSPVTVFLGSGADAGKLRIEPGHGFNIALRPGRFVGEGKAPLSIRIPTPPGMTVERKMLPTIADADWGLDWVEVTLPHWARPPGPVPAAYAARPPTAPPPGPGVTSAAAPRRQPGKPFVGVMDREPDPDALRRRGHGPLPANPARAQRPALDPSGKIAR